MAGLTEIALQALREIREGKEGKPVRPAVWSRVWTPLGVGTLQPEAFPDRARVLLDGTRRHLPALVDLPWEHVQLLM